jgi:hypothetical protein
MFKLNEYQILMATSGGTDGRLKLNCGPKDMKSVPHIDVHLHVYIPIHVYKYVNECKCTYMLSLPFGECAFKSSKE